jgi:hypothetical protein
MDAACALQPQQTSALPPNATASVKSSDVLMYIYTRYGIGIGIGVGNMWIDMQCYELRHWPTWCRVGLQLQWNHWSSKGIGHLASQVL